MILAQSEPSVPTSDPSLLVPVDRKQRDGLLPRQVQLRPAEPHAQLSLQAAQNGRNERHEVPAPHHEEAGLGALLHPEATGPGLDGTHGAARRAGCGGGRGIAGG